MRARNWPLILMSGAGVYLVITMMNPGKVIIVSSVLVAGLLAFLILRSRQ